MFLKEQDVLNIVLFCCCVVACYFTSTQFMEYFKNEDSSVLTYQKHLFDSESKHQYPTYSVCFRKFWNSIRLNESDFEDLVHVLRCGFNFCQDFDRGKMPLKKTMQSRVMHCYSVHHKRNTEMREFGSITDTVSIQASKLLELKMDVAVYIHRGGQLIRHIMTANSPEAEQYFNWELKSLLFQNNRSYEGVVKFSIGNAVVLRNREDGIHACNSSLLDEDQIWRETVIQMVGCIPKRWLKFFGDQSNGLPKHDCTLEQDNMIAEHERDPYLFKNTSKLYTNPCDVMESQVKIDRKWIPSNDMQLVLKFKYASARYLEISNYKAYNGETLLGQVGGYIGK